MDQDKKLAIEPGSRFPIIRLIDAIPKVFSVGDEVLFRGYDNKSNRVEYVCCEDYRIKKASTMSPSDFYTLTGVDIFVNTAEVELVKSKTTRPPLKDNVLRRWNGSAFVPNENIVLGRAKDIILPNGERRYAKYAIVSMNDVIASHQQETFASSEGYPVNESGYNINDRNYQGDRAAQAIVQQYASNLEPELLITNVATPSGTPIISTDGIVISGNNRTMSLKLASSNAKAKYALYLDTLRSEAMVFGLDMTTMKVEKPILVRIDYDFEAYTTQELAKYNAQETKGKHPVDKAVELANILQENAACQASLPKILGEYERISDFYSTPSDCYKMIKLIEGCGILNQNEIVTYFDKDTNSFTEGGKDFLETTLVAIVLQRDALIAANTDGVKSLRQVLVTTLPVLMANKSLGEPALNRYLNDAVEFQLEVKNSGLKFGEYLAQGNLFEAKKYPVKALVLNRLLQLGRNAFKAAISSYNASILSSAGATMFGEPVTPEEAFDLLIKSKIDNADVKAIDDYAKRCGICQHSKGDNTIESKPTTPLSTKSIERRIRVFNMLIQQADSNTKKRLERRIRVFELLLTNV